MHRSNLFILSLFCFLLSLKMHSQNNNEVKDTVNIERNKIDVISKSGFSKFIYKLIYKKPPSKKTTEIPKKISTERVINHCIYDKKIIRNIYINTYDPFGYSIEDTLKKPKSRLDKIGNSIHIKTKQFTIKNLLLFKENQAYDSLKIVESERLIRSQRYTRRTKIIPLPISEENDSIDLEIRVLDSWSILPNGSLSSNKGSFKLTERNLLGLGHQVSGTYKYRFDDGEKTISSRYTINNIKNTFLRIDLGYDNDFDNNSRRYFSISRLFYSPITKWAGGVYFENKAFKEGFGNIILDSVIVRNTRSEYQEYWLARSFKLSNSSNYFMRTTRFVTSLTFNERKFSEKPDALIDYSNYFTDEKNIIGQIGISSQQYYQDKFLFNYDIIEDIPYGKRFALLFGHQEKWSESRFYFGSKLSFGKKYSFGYVSGATEWGSFFNNGKTEQTGFRVEFNYFTNLMYLGNWKIRQFVQPSYVWGNNRLDSEKDLLTLNENLGIQGFNSPIFGTQKWLLNLQTQTYTPGSWKGFRFSPYINTTFGALADSKNNLFTSRIYSKFSLGVLINNDYLVFNSFQISFSYYPSIPFDGTNIIKTNSFGNDDLYLSNFQLSRPSYILYE